MLLNNKKLWERIGFATRRRFDKEKEEQKQCIMDMQDEMISGCGSFENIRWVKNEDNSFTFTNTIENGLYAWYVLDKNKEVICKTTYTKNQEFTYDLKDNRELIIKGYVRIPNETDYEQSVCSILTSKILNRKKITIVKVETETDVAYCTQKYIFLRAKYKYSLEKVMSKKLFGVDISLPFDWSCSMIDDRNLCCGLHGLKILDNVYVEYEKTQENVYKETIMKYMLDWVENNAIPLEGNKWAWHDDATAQRVISMSYYYYLFGKDFSGTEKSLIEKSLYNQIKLLLNEDFYTKMHNHGMYQDFAILVYASLLADDELKRKCYETVYSRVYEYFRYALTEDGIHKEHSPIYALEIGTVADVFVKVATDVAPQFAQEIGDILRNTYEYLLQNIKPDGSWPSIGDSPKKHMVGQLDLLEHHLGYEYVLTRGQSGEPPQKECVFPKGGYAIMRSSWDDTPQEATWMMFTASTFSSAHKHSDDLNFLLYHKGDLFVEGGNRDYNYKHEKTAWIYSSYAHNVLLVNGESYPVKIGESGFQAIYPSALETKIVDYNLSEKLSWITGVQKRYEDITQYRTLVYDKVNNLVSVEDKITAVKDFEGTLLYHIAEEVVVVDIEGGWELYRDNELVAVIKVKSNEKFTLTTIRGEECESPYNTWIFEGKEEPSYGSLLKIDVSCHGGVNNVSMNVSLK